MQLRNHIVYRFLTEKHFLNDILRSLLPIEVENLIRHQQSDEEMHRIAMTYKLLEIDEQKAYYITNTVVDKLDMLKVTNKNGIYDWTVFKHVKPCKLTFIFKNNSFLRVWIHHHVIQFLHGQFVYYSQQEKLKYKATGTIDVVQLYVDRNTGEPTAYFAHASANGMEETFYKLLCFFFLSENQEIIVNPGKSYGTKKQPDALSNDINVPVTIVNSCWNITSIRTDGFDVSGHFRLQPCGPALADTRMIFIEPYKKHGYVRKAAKPLE
ncbi:hypothetical protein [Mucilaginibacter paludis]|uniref:Uncharacterized protein n=1 Tax=Mucilaginibacter paludis DSM 18603 TaxID=714943 RepID=H1YI04_9SPHI|nr:hypothetical protein [Mucilaginibacter paludis]EHQ25552.1 hypothetical protein Mucpa_1392 [Mucilaginibacter paludis DSM 18603]